ncbi:MAG: CopD family protein [Deltaproteobacteria bacterium]|nr:CopD family protein [Deltaproteobacteria bacterium]
MRAVRRLNLKIQEDEMKGLILLTCYFAHLLAAVIWVGGIIFILYIAIPSSRQVLGREAGKLMGDISKRFTPVANCSILSLVITGVVLTWSKKYFQGSSFFESVQGAMSLKYLLALMMIGIHFYRGLVLAPKIIAAEPSQKSFLQKISLNLVKVNLWLGVIILLLSGIMRG